MTALCTALLLASAAPTRPASTPVDHGPRDQPRVALTFDACSGPAPGKLDEGVVSALTAAKVRATFFLGGRWAEQDHERVARLAANPDFELESHTYHHAHLLTLSDAALQAELARANEILGAMLGHAPRYVRAPYAEADARVVRAAAAAGLVTIGLDVASGDPDPSFNPKRLTKWVLRSVRPGSIVVFHANGRGWHTAEALPDIIAGLRAKGFELVTVAELLAEPAPGPDAGQP